MQINSRHTISTSPQVRCQKQQEWRTNDVARDMSQFIVHILICQAFLHIIAAPWNMNKRLHDLPETKTVHLYTFP